MKTALLYLITAVAVVVLGGCGVVRSTSAILKAQQAYQAANAVEAEKRAPYEYTLGSEYLRKAWEEAGYSDYQVSERLATRAETLLLEARRLAESEGAGDPTADENGLEE